MAAWVVVMVMFVSCAKWRRDPKRGEAGSRREVREAIGDRYRPPREFIFRGAAILV
jgi:hypothetical protein